MPTDDTERLLEQSQSVNDVREILWLVCFRCKVPCAHDVLAEVRNRWSVGEDSARLANRFQIVQCGGCKSVGYRHIQSISTRDDETPLFTSEERHPVREDESARRAFRGIQAIPILLRKIYLETLRAINENSPILAGIGIRAIVEGVCKHKQVQGNDLSLRIEGLGTARVLGATQVALLHKLRFLGNRAAHETEAPTVDELSAAMDIVEHLLETVYVLPETGNRLAAR